MDYLTDMLWIEYRKALRSRMPLWTALGSLFMPLGIAFLIFVSKNPEISKKMGLISAKANLIAYAGTDWPTYLGSSGLMIAAGGFILYVLAVSWIFGREFADGTVKDLLAVPVPRASILLAKFIVAALWSAALTIVIYIASVLMGALLQLPGGSLAVILQGGVMAAVTASMTVAVVLPFAFFASVGRGYLLPVGMAILTLMMTNLVVVIGRGEIFPWAIPGLYAQGKSALTPLSYLIVASTCLVGMFATYLWWKYADQNR